MKIEFIENNKTYWFIVDGENYGINDINGDRTMLDTHGEPIRERDMPAKIFFALCETIDEMEVD